MLSCTEVTSGAEDRLRPSLSADTIGKRGNNSGDGGVTPQNSALQALATKDSAIDATGDAPIHRLPSADTVHPQHHSSSSDISSSVKPRDTPSSCSDDSSK